MAIFKIENVGLRGKNCKNFTHNSVGIALN